MDNAEKQIEKKEIKQKKENKNDIISKIKSIKNIEIIIAVIAVIIMLIIYFGSKSAISNKNTNTAVTTNTVDYCDKITTDLIDTLSKMDGAGEVKVIINWESSVETIIAYSTNSNNNSTSTTPQIISGSNGSSPIVLKEVYPRALGVIIICQGGDDVKIKLDIINAVATLLSIEPQKINVYKMTK